MSNHYHHGNLKDALIQAGIDILSQEGVQGFSLRKVAKKAGVSHAAPYAHFADRQALIAAISTQGYIDLYHLLLATSQKHEGNPAKRLAEMAVSYTEYAVENSEQFKITFSGIVEKEKNFPAFVEVSKKSFDLVVSVVNSCIDANLIKNDDPELVAINIWSGVHGFVLLLLENQISSSLTTKYSNRDILVSLLQNHFDFPQSVNTR